eukprot:ANDGO_06554.mRNA.1 Adenylate cyclase
MTSFEMTGDNQSGAEISVTYDALPLILSWFMSCIGAYTSLQIAGTVIHLDFLSSKPTLQDVVLLLSASTMSSISVFCMHFMGMTAVSFDGIPFSFDVVLTLISFFSIELLGTWALFIALRCRKKRPVKKSSNVSFAMDSPVPAAAVASSSSFSRPSVAPYNTVSVSSIDSEAGLELQQSALLRSSERRKASVTQILNIEVPSSRVASESDVELESPMDGSPLGTAVTPRLHRRTKSRLRCISRAVMPNLSKLYGKHVKMPVFTFATCILMFAIGVIAMHHVGILSYRGDFCQVQNYYAVAFSTVFGLLVCIFCVTMVYLCPSGLWLLSGSFVLGTAFFIFHFMAASPTQFVRGSCPVLSSSLPSVNASLLSVVVIFSAFFALAVMQVILSFTLSSSHLKSLELMKRSVEQEQKLDALLYCMLPETVVCTLKRTGRFHQKIPDCTIVFLDLCNFTSLSESTDSEELVASLDDIFSQIDECADRLGIEKVKSLGDGGLYVSGAPDPCEDHAIRAVEFGLQVQNLVRRGSLTLCGHPFDVRIGAASGSLMSGVTGLRKCAWDVYGNVCNLASRMESTGEPGAFQIAVSVMDRLNARPDLMVKFDYRPAVRVKGIGVVDTYICRRYAAAPFPLSSSGELSPV